MKKLMILVILALMAFVSCTSADKDNEVKKVEVEENMVEMEELKVRVTYLERMILRPGSELTVTLEDVSKMDVASTIISEEKVVLEGTPPYEVTIKYNKDDIKDMNRYSVRASIKYMDTLMFISTTANNPFETEEDTLEIVVEKVNVDNAVLEDTEWKLYKLGDMKVEVEERPYIVLQKETGIINGYTGVNNISGEYILGAKILKFEKLFMTQMYNEEHAELEAGFVEVLNSDLTYIIFGNTLTFYDKDMNQLAVFQK